MATVYIETRKREQRNSYIIYYKHPVSGKNKYHKTLQEKKEAQSEANRLRSLLDTGKLPEEQILKSKPLYLTVSDVGEMLNQLWVDKLSRKELSPDTVDCYQRWLDKIKFAFKGKLVCEIRENDIIGYRNVLAESRSNVTSNRVLFVFKQLLKIALAHSIIHDDPSKDIKYLSEK